MLTSNKPEVKVRVIQIEEAKVTTKQVIETLKTIDGNVAPNKEKDIAKAALFERHKATGTKGLGFVKGFGLKKALLHQLLHMIRIICLSLVPMKRIWLLPGMSLSKLVVG